MFLPETGAFLPLPKLATEPFLKLWEQEVFALLLAEGKINQELAAGPSRNFQVFDPTPRTTWIIPLVSSSV